jgi:diguanylate cyclase (GGDEF)-like protein
MIDLGETLAQPKDRYRAAIGAAGVVVLAVATLPVVATPLGASYPIFSTAYGISIVMIILAAVLLWAQSRVTASVPLLVLAASYGATVLVMIPHLLLFRGLFPQLAAWLSADPQTSSWLWFEWHLAFSLCPIAYLIARQGARTVDRARFSRLQTRALVVMIVLPAVLVAPAVWIDGLPVMVDQHGRTWIAIAASAIIVAIAIATIVALFVRYRFRSILDVWLAIAALCMVTDVVLSLVGSSQFTVGWYVSRFYIVIASSTVLVALLGQTANVYAQLAKTADRLRDESLTDPLTGLSNRRAFDVRIAQVLADGARMSRGAAMLMIDVDQFKLFNDAYGHLGGDECLRDLADTARGCVSRTRDMVARYGGEEFAVIMAETDLRGALIVAERIRSAIEGMGVPQSSEAAYPAITVSIGATAVETTEGLTVDAFIEQADKALYRAKELGRNRTQSWPLDVPAIADPPQADATGNERGIDAGSRATIS